MGNRDRHEIRQQEYTRFYVLREVSEFRLFFNASSTPLSGLPALGDCLIFVAHNPFSTFDHDNSWDECATVHGSGWWFAYSLINCGYCNPNGVLVQSTDSRRTGVDNEVFWITDWSPWYTEMWLECRVWRCWIARILNEIIYQRILAGMLVFTLIFVSSNFIL